MSDEKNHIIPQKQQALLVVIISSFLPIKKFFNRLNLFLLLFLLLISEISQGQIPLFKWQAHFSAFPPLQITSVNSQVWASSLNMLYTVLSNGEIKSFTQYNGLRGYEISRIVGINKNSTLFVLYKNGGLDIIKDEEIIYSSQLISTESISIYHHQILDDKILLSSSEGLIVYSISTRQISDLVQIKTSSGSSITRISWFHNNAVWILGDTGIYYLENLDANWKDNSLWKRVILENTGQNPEPLFNFGTYNNNKIYLGNAQFLFVADMKGFKIQNIQPLNFNLSSEAFKNIKLIENKVIIFTNKNAYQWLNNQKILLALDLINLQLVNEKIYGLSSEKGLILVDNSLSNTVDANSLSPSNINSNNSNTILSKANKTITISDVGIHLFQNRTWTNIPKKNLSPTITYIPSQNKFLAVSDKTFISIDEQGKMDSFGTYNDIRGNIQKIEYISNTQTIFVLTDDYYFPLYTIDLMNAFPVLTYVIIPDLGFLSTPFKDFLIYRHLIFLISKNANGMTVFDMNSETSRKISTVNNQGGLPSNQINALSVDYNQLLWVATDSGVVYFSSPLQLADESATVNAFSPIIDNARLLSNESVTSLFTDHANRKWLASKNGLWLVNANGNQLLKRFIKASNQLPSNLVQLMEYEDGLGELFVQTDLGLVSVKIDVQAPKTDYSSVRIFPNPVPKDFNNDVTIDGLKEGTTIKITDTNLQVIYESISGNSGSIVWDLTTKNNSRVKAGLYLIFMTNGEEKHTERIVVWR